MFTFFEIPPQTHVPFRPIAIEAGRHKVTGIIAAVVDDVIKGEGNITLFDACATVEATEVVAHVHGEALLLANPVHAMAVAGVHTGGEFEKI